MNKKVNSLPGGSETILIVDDHETIWDFLIEALQQLGYSVLLAENGLDAVEIYEANPSQIDLVLLDMIMPKQGGHQTFFRIRSIDPKAKILLSSGFVSEAEVHALLQQGACGFLPKPHRLPTVAKARPLRGAGGRQGDPRGPRHRPPCRLKHSATVRRRGPHG